jgi:hypothetical protein
MERKRKGKKAQRRRPERPTAPASTGDSAVLEPGTSGQERQPNEGTSHQPSVTSSRPSLLLGESSLTFTSLAHVDEALNNPHRTPTTLTHTLIDLKTTMSQEEGQLATINLLVHERKKLMMQLADRVKAEERRLLGERKSSHENQSGEDEPSQG